MPLTEFGEHLIQQKRDSALSKRQYPFTNARCALLVRGIKWTDQNAGGIGMQNKVCAFDMNRAHIRRKLDAVALQQRERVPHELHLREREQKGKRRFRSLVAV